MNVVLILPTYNERDTILVLLEQASEAFASLAHHSFSYLVVDDSSPDGTAEAVEEFAKKHKNIYVLRGKKEGLGRALLRGMTYAVEKLQADILVQMDADLSHDPKVLPKFIKALDGGADIAIGSRYIPGGAIPENWGFRRKLYSTVGNGIVRFGLGHPSIHDWTGGYRAFYKKYYEVNKEKVTKYSGYVFQIAFLHNAVLAGANVYEVPIKFVDRRFGYSKIAAKEYIRHVLEYVFTQRLLSLRYGNFKKFLVVGGVGFIINTVILEFSVNAIGLQPAVGSIIGAECAIVSNFFLNNAWTFRDQTIEKGKRLTKLLQFNTAALGAILIQATSVFFGDKIFGDSWYRLFYVIGVGIGLIYNYIMYSKVIWKK
jgi:dolichol-phosphate mannosyltransferase